MSHYIEIEQTPNPNAIKIIVSKNWVDFIWECYNLTEASKSSLAKKLFLIPGVVYLLFGKNFVVITKKPEVVFDQIVQAANEYVIDFLQKKESLFEADCAVFVSAEKNLNELEKKMVLILQEKIQPALESHGGAIEFIKFENGVLFLNLKGACKNCPSSEITLRDGIFSLMNYFFPEIKNVVSC